MVISEICSSKSRDCSQHSRIIFHILLSRQRIVYSQECEECIDNELLGLASDNKSVLQNKGQARDRDNTIGIGLALFSNSTIQVRNFT